MRAIPVKSPLNPCDLGIGRRSSPPIGKRTAEAAVAATLWTPTRAGQSLTVARYASSTHLLSVWRKSPAPYPSCVFDAGRLQGRAAPSVAPVVPRGYPDPPRAARTSSASIRRPDRETRYALTRAPSGRTPWSRYRQKAISSLRASATMPIRRARPWAPNRCSNHRLRALVG